MDEKNPYVLAFLEHVRTVCESHNVALWFAPQKYFLVDGKRVHGFFQQPRQGGIRGELGVAMKTVKQDLLEVIAHEFAHLEQWRSGYDIWLEEDALHARIEGMRLSGTPVPDELLIQLYVLKRNLELDCERRTLALIAEWNLPIDRTLYIAYANLHILEYTHCIEDLIDTIPDQESGSALLRYLSGLYPKQFVEGRDSDINFFSDFDIGH